MRDPRLGRRAGRLPRRRRVLRATRCYLTLGRWADDRRGTSVDRATTPGSRSSTARMQQRERDVLTVHDYLWRWDTDWFWCSRAFGAQSPLVRRLWPRQPAAQRRLLEASSPSRTATTSWPGSTPGAGRPPRERVVQDVEIPLDRTAEFLDWFLREVPIEPVWLCPIQLRPRPASHRGRPDGTTPWPLYPMRPDEPYVNVGFWSTVAIEPGARRRRRQPRHRATRSTELGRPQVPLLRRLLRRGHVRPALRRRGYRPSRSGTTPRGGFPPSTTRRCAGDDDLLNRTGP